MKAPLRATCSGYALRWVVWYGWRSDIYMNVLRCGILLRHVVALHMRKRTRPRAYIHKMHNALAIK